MTITMKHMTPSVEDLREVTRRLEVARCDAAEADARLNALRSEWDEIIKEATEKVKKEYYYL